ncbi:MAG: lipid carrier--UDP-N-acetylgalactosaminyltransferase [Candidatus Marinimicrobia bacterium]|nr:lipid carrier--UDP-N-acetylgalactosaminyltransferase [Candidatus Neomarinimicrobiota bacterium]
MQTFIDTLLSLIAIILLSPLLLPIIFILKITGEGEIFYTQKRVGRHGKEFGLLKFATMLKDSPNIGAGEITIHNDPRVLPIGKILRKTKLNELPQLFNIIKGDMSIVGPRPMVPKTYAKYTKEAQTTLNTIRPGLTGIGSIFFRDEEKFLIDKDDPMAFYEEYIIPYKSDLEVWYVKNNSITLYVQIILITAWVVIFSKSKIAEKIFNEIPKRPKVLL